MSQREPRIKDHGHLDFIRELPCVVCGNNIETQAAHVRYAEPLAGKRPSGNSEKPHDHFTIPLCGACHLGPGGQHTTNERGWWQNIGIDPVYLALALWRVSGDHAAGSRIVSAWHERITTD